jgi:ribosome-associated protein
MVKMLIDGTDSMSVSDIEYRLKLDPSYTIKVLSAWEAEQGEKPLLLIGADSLLELHTWYQAEKLVNDYEFMVYPRRGSSVNREDLLRHWSSAVADKLLSSLLPGEIFEISSSEIRESVAKSAQWCDIMKSEKTLTTEADVLRYASEHHLYTGEKKMAENTGKKISPEELLKCCIDCADEKLARDPVTLKVDEGGVADYFLVVTADSEPQLQAVAGFIERTVRDRYNLRSLSQSAGNGGGWLLLDFGTVVVHVMTPEVRGRYDLESLWGELLSLGSEKN